MFENDPLFQSLQLGGLSLYNRVVMTTLKLGYSNKIGEITERHIAFYQRRAAGKVGLMTSEPMYVQLNGRELPTQLGIYADKLVPGLRWLTGAVHAAGGRIMAHINRANFLNLLGYSISYTSRVWGGLDGIRTADPRWKPDLERCNGSRMV